MAVQTDRAIPSEETFNMLRDRAAKDGDGFAVKVMRRAHMGAMPELIASLSGATLENLTTPELWIPPLCGGGNFSMQAYHPTDMSRPVGGFLQVKISQDAKDVVDASVMKKNDWRGPATLDFPKIEARDPAQTSMYDVKSPPAPGTAGDQRHQNNQAGYSRSAGGGSVHAPEYGSESFSQERQRLQGALEQEKRKLEEERLAIEREKHRDQIDALKKSHEADMRSLKSEMMAEIQRNKPTGPDSSVVMFETMMKMQSESARQAAEDRREREKIAADDRRAAEARQAANDERFNRLLEKMSDRPKEDPLAMITKVTELMGKNGGGNEKMMHTMMETMGTINGVAMDFVEHAANMQLGAREEKESPIVKGIEAAVKGLGAMARGAQQRPAPQQFQQPHQPPTFEQQARQQQMPSSVPPGQPGSSAAMPQSPPAPAPAQPQATVLEQIEFGIWQKAPIAQVANAIVNHLQDPSIQAALFEAGMDFDVLINNRLGVWSKQHVDNEAYLKLLTDEVEKQLRAAGHIPPEDNVAMVEDEQGDDQGDEDQE